MKKMVVVALVVILMCCTSADRAEQTLIDSGYSEVETTGYSWSCSKDDSTCTGFRARSPGGRIVEGAVGCGRAVSECAGKGCTIRLGN